LKIELQESGVTSNGSPIFVRELDQGLGLSDLIAAHRH
jgi:hypothetical protein